MLIINNKNFENDYELLYLIENQSEEALNIMFDKYSNLIHSIICKFGILDKDYDDFYQEARLMLFKAINTFDLKYQKTFTMYFKMLLENRFKTLIKQYNNLKYYEVLSENNDFFIEENNEMLEIDVLKMLSSVEKEVYFRYFLGGISIDELCKSLNLTKKQAYNSIFRVNKKLKIEKNKLINKIN